jgi:hypothetical protein
VASIRVITAAVDLTYSVFWPCSLDRPTFANCSAAASRAAAASGSASTTRASSTVSNLDQDSRPSAYSATPASTNPACSGVRSRVATATFRATHVWTSHAVTRAHSRGSRCRTSSTSASNARAA